MLPFGGETRPLPSIPKKKKTIYIFFPDLQTPKTPELSALSVDVHEPVDEHGEGRDGGAPEAHGLGPALVR